MNLRWLFGNFTDPQYKLPRKEQFRLSNKAHTQFVRPKDFWWHTFLIVLPFLVLFALLEPFLAWLGYRASSLAYTLGCLALLLIFWPWCAWMYRSLYIVPIRKVMRDAGYILCLNCGYELKGLPDDVERCPECGATRQRSVEVKS